MLAYIEQNMLVLAPYRKPALFNEFLLKGYTAVTLSCVPANKFSELLQAKLCMGTLITLYDDFADRPATSNPELLERLYQLNFNNHSAVKIFNDYNSQVVNFASSLFSQMTDVLQQLPHYKEFSDVLNFDLLQFYSANQYSSLLTAKPYLNNTLENRRYTHHNMGMVIVFMMDLMAADQIDRSELGAIREVFLYGQRMGRIFNVLATRHREALDGDVTGELTICKTHQELNDAIENLYQEIEVLKRKILGFEKQIKTFSVATYLEGLIQVQKLHEKMEGTI